MKAEMIPVSVLESQTVAKREIKHARKYPEFDEMTAATLVADAGAGLSLGAACALPGRPSRRVVKIWMQTNPDFAAELEAAADDRADALAERALNVASDTLRDPACRRIETDVLKWMASKVSKNYASKGGELTLTQTNINVEGDMNVSPAEAYQRMLHG